MNIFQTFIKSLYSPTYVGRFRFKGMGRTIGYIFFLMILASIPAAISLTNTVFSGVNQLESALTHEELPDFTITDGRLTVDEKEPYLNTTDNHENRIIFDLSGETSEADLASGKNVTAFLENKLVLRTNGENRTFFYDLAGNFTISKGDIASLIGGTDALLLIFIPVTILVMYLLTTALKFVGIFGLSLFGLITQKRAPIPLSYRHLWIICAYTVTMPTIFITVVNLFPVQLPAHWQNILYWFLAFLWLYTVFTKLPRKKQQ